MGIELNIEDDVQSKSNKKVKDRNNGILLTNLNEFEISKVFANLGAQNRTLVVPIGFPGAGKSLLFSSLLWYGQKCTDANFKITVKGNNDSSADELDQFYQNGKFINDEMVDDFHNKKLYERTKIGSLDLIAVDITPTKHESNPKKFPKLPLAYLDLSGEDLKQIKTSEGGEFNSKINAVFNGIQTEGSNMIFLLITSFEPAREADETNISAHNREDTLHANFLNYIETTQNTVFNNSRFIVIVTKWDKNNKYPEAEDFIREKRPAIYQILKNSGRAVWGEYSVGTILENKVDGIVMQEIHRQNIDYPSRLWKKMYQICTNRDLDYKTFWEKLFS